MSSALAGSMDTNPPPSATKGYFISKKVGQVFSPREPGPTNTIFPGIIVLHCMDYDLNVYDTPVHP